MQTSPSGRAAIARREGNRLTAYLDSVGVWTIGVGHTSAAGLPKVTKGMTITAAQADEILARDLAGVEAAVSALVKARLNQNEFDALVSLTFNIGAGAFKGSSVLKRLNTGDRAGAADAMLLWNKGTVGGRKVALAGLTARRGDERVQFLSAAPPPTPARDQPAASPAPPVTARALPAALKDRIDKGAGLLAALAGASAYAVGAPPGFVIGGIALAIITILIIAAIRRK